MNLLASHLNCAFTALFPYALHHAAERGDVQKLKELLEKYPHQRRRIHTRRSHWLTPIDLAVAYEHWACVAILLEAGANPSTKDQYYGKKTLLHTAFNCQSISAVRLLIIYGADIDIKDGHNKSCRELIDQYSLLQDVFYHTLALKEKLDVAQIQADRAIVIKDNRQAALHLKEVAQYWETLAIAEEMPSLKRHYYQKALQRFEEAHSYVQGDGLSDHILRLQGKLTRQDTNAPLRAHLERGLFSQHSKDYQRLGTGSRATHEQSPLLRQSF